MVGRLPRPLRYAAVAELYGSVLIAGGTSGTSAQRAILQFDPHTRTVKRVGTLPVPLTHAAGATLGGRFLVIGGRGDAPNSASRRIWAFAPGSGQMTVAGRLPVALSDLAAAPAQDRVLALGGRDGVGKVHDEILGIRRDKMKRPSIMVLAVSAALLAGGISACGKDGNSDPAPASTAKSENVHARAARHAGRVPPLHLAATTSTRPIAPGRLSPLARRLPGS